MVRLLSIKPQILIKYEHMLEWTFLLFTLYAPVRSVLQDSETWPLRLEIRMTKPSVARQPAGNGLTGLQHDRDSTFSP